MKEKEGISGKPERGDIERIAMRLRHWQQGIAAERAGRLREAAEHYAVVHADDPQDREVARHLGLVLLRLGDAAGAVRCLRPLAGPAADAAVLLAFGSALLVEGEAAEAEEMLGRARRLAPENAAVVYSHGNALVQAGRLEDAVEAYRAALALRPELAEAEDSLGAALRALHMVGDAAEAHRRALVLRPGWAGAQYNLGLALRDAGDAEAAVATFEEAARFDDGFLRAHWHHALTLPDIYETEEQVQRWRARCDAAFAAVESRFAALAPEALPQAVAAIASGTAFFRHYQGCDDTAFQRRYGGLLARVAAAAFPAASEPPRRAAGRRCRVAVVAQHVHRQTVWKLFSGWLPRLDRARFEVLLFHTGRRRDADTAAALRLVDGYRDIGALPPAARIAVIREAAPDAILYPEVGMEPGVQLLAALRLAPLQLVAFGHPVTTGLPTLDGFLSAALFEPADGERHYTERLLRLPNLGIAYARPDVSAARRPDFADAVRGSGPLYVCAQSLFKLLPRYDPLFPRIAQTVPGARLVFVEGTNRAMTETFHRRLTRAFEAAGLDVAGHVAIVPRMPEPLFLGLCAEADVILDSPGWSGGNSTLEALATGTPVVTWEGAMMRARVTAGMLRRAGLDDLVARDADGYVAAAARLADPAVRTEAEARLSDGRAALYDDAAPVAALADLLESAMRGQ
ncbi:MAG: tetratricopeptide repeat protein [Acetobacterales bacterium]